jgi:uncharacterized protein with ATP-grasp and redox domains
LLPLNWILGHFDIQDIYHCSEEFRRRFAEADLIVAKGQGNFETLSNNPSNIFCLFKVKCGVIANLVNQPIGMQMLIHSQLGLGQKC